MAAYLTVTEFKIRTIMPSGDVDACEGQHPGFLDAKLSEHSAKINGRLRKRYAVPFVAPVPEVVLSWLEALTTKDGYLKQGFHPESAQDMEILERAKHADIELKEAADSNTGLFDLPLREDMQRSGVSAGGPLGYSETSPYTWTRRQKDEARYGR